MHPHSLPDGSGFFVALVPAEPTPREPICWNPWNKVVQDHRDGTVDHALTNIERAKRGLSVPWLPSFNEIEVQQPPSW